MLSLPEEVVRRTSEHQITRPRSDSPVSRTPELLILLLVAVLVASAIALGGGSSKPAARRERIVSPAHIRLVERRVEGLRDLRFRRPVPVAIVSPREARRELAAEARRSQPPAQQQTNAELLKLLALLPADADFGAIQNDVYEQQIAGYYDPRRRRLALVRGAGVDDVTLAHELTHALEDQYADIARLGEDSHAGDDASTAQQSLVEGSATLVMERYAQRWPSRQPLGDALSGLTQATGARPLPPYVARTLVFPYFQGEAFVQALLDAGDGSWTLVNVAERARPPVSTAEILQPQRWLRAQQPLPVSLPAPGSGWRRLAGSTLGSEDLAALLSPSTGPAAARELTAGWRGGRYALWRRGPAAAAGCAAPCRARDAAALAARMRDAGEARALGAALRTWAARLPAGSATAVRVDGPTVRAALAPDSALAARLAG
jgi:hypothetical protein